MKKKLVTKWMAGALAVGMTLSMGACGQTKGNNSGDPERKDASAIVEDNKADTAEKEEKPEQKTEKTKSTEYPLTITTYGSDGAELTTTYEKAPEKVLAVYQGSIETLLALGLEDHIVAAAGLDNEVPEEQKAAFSKLNYLDEFSPGALYLEKKHWETLPDG